METILKRKAYIKRTQRDYSLEFKRKLVHEVESGKFNVRQAALEYGVQAASTVREWVRRYGVWGGEHRAVECATNKSPEERLQELEGRVRLLEKQRELLEEQLNAQQEKAAKFDIIADIATKKAEVQALKYA